MVFAVTPTGLERISYEKYWKECEDSKLQNLNREESWKEKLLSPSDDRNLDNNMSVQENSSLLYIDHEIDGYETCLDDDSSKQEKAEKTDDRKPDIKRESKQNFTHVPNKDNDASAKTKTTFQIMANGDDEESSFGRPYLQEHIIKQMKSLRIEPLNVNISKKRKRSATKPKPSKGERKCVEYYNDQAECLEEYNRQKRLEEDERKTKEEENRLLQSNLHVMEKKLQLKKQEPSEESTDLESGFVPVPGCHKCFLENYAYELTKAYADKNCKYCAVIRDYLELETPKDYERRLSAPALFSVDSVSETDDENYLLVPSRDRRKSAGPLKFLQQSRKMSNISPAMTVTARGSGSQRWGQPRRVTVTRSPGAPLGVSVVGGKVDIITGRGADEEPEKAIFGIFIKNVVPASPAGNCKELYTGDRILEVDGVCVRSASHERAVQLIKAAGDTVTLTVQSLVAWNTDSSDIDGSPPSPSPSTKSMKKKAPPPPVDGTPQHEIKITVTAEPDTDENEKESGPTEKEIVAEPPKSSYSDSESSDEEDERDLGGRVYSDKGVEIDRASAGAIKRSREEKEADPEQEDEFGYTTNKIRKKYAGLGDSVVAVRLERSPKAGLGLSLAGHRDRSRMAVFVCGLNPAGSAAKSAPPVKLGDEILEVNGIVLHGRCHLNASAIIKGLAGPVFKIILLRRKQALEDVAVKPLVPSQFPVALDEESEDRFAGYKGVHNVSIKKGSSSLGIMIIEGRHAEVGQGIFISDIQDGSAAEQAGLQIGDMILAVNKDSLLGCSYDAAAATLKRTEGVVVLTVCNPNKKDDSPDDAASVGGASRPTSRNQTPDPGLKPGGASRPTTPKPPASPSKPEPAPDPAIAPILSNKDTVIEIATINQTLGLLVLGGSDTLINGPAAVILEVYPGGAAAKDGRLQHGDLICECNGVPLTKEMTRERICLTVKQTAAKMKMTIRRPDPIQYSEVEVEIARKPGKGIGLGLMARTPPPGVYISDLLAGGPADLDGRLQRGDIVVSVDGKDLTSAGHETAATAFKSVGARAAIKVKRFKIVR